MVVLMEIIHSVTRTGMVNVLLFYATRRSLLAQTAVSGWRGLFRLSGFTESNPTKDAEKPFTRRGTERGDTDKEDLEEVDESLSPQPQLLLDDPLGPQMRIKIENHIDNAGENRDSIDTDRSTVPNSPLAFPQRPLPVVPRRPLPAVPQRPLPTPHSG